MPSEYEPADNSAYDLIVTANPAARPGQRNITCYYEGRPYSGTSITIYDASPEIDAIIQYAPETSGGPFYVSLFGRNFGATQGTVSACNSGAFPCNGTANLAVNQNAPFSVWRDDQVNVQLSPSPGTVGVFEIQLSSVGATGLGFAPAPQGQSSAQSNRATVQVNAAASSVQILRADPKTDQIAVGLSGVVGSSGTLRVTLRGNSEMVLRNEGSRTRNSQYFL